MSDSSDLSESELSRPSAEADKAVEGSQLRSPLDGSEGDFSMRCLELTYNLESPSRRRSRGPINESTNAKKARRSPCNFLLVHPLLQDVGPRNHIFVPRPLRPITNQSHEHHDQEFTGFQASKSIQSNVKLCQANVSASDTRSPFLSMSLPIAADTPRDYHDQVSDDEDLPMISSPFRRLRTDTEESFGTPIRLSLKPIPVDLDILSVVTCSTVPWRDHSTPTPRDVIPDSLWAPRLTLSDATEPTLTPDTSF